MIIPTSNKIDIITIIPYLSNICGLDVNISFNSLQCACFIFQTSSWFFTNE